MTKNPRLTDRDLNLTYSIGRFKFLTTFQIQNLFFSDASRFAATNRLSTLVRDGFISRVFSYPKAQKEKYGHPTAIYFWGTKNQNRLKDYLEKNGSASKWEDFRILPPNTQEEFSQIYLVHETGISEFFLTLEEATKKENTPELIFWERTSPKSKEIGEHLTVDIEQAKGFTKIKVFFNPDAFFCLKDQEGFYSLFFLEYDNNTASLPKYRQKLEGYQAYHRERKFPDLLERYKRKYLLDIQNTQKAGFRVLTITPDEKRRDQLFIESLKLHSYKMLWFASLTDLTSETILSSVWLRGKEFSPIAEELKILEKDLSPQLKSRLISEKLSKMKRVSLND